MAPNTVLRAKIQVGAVQEHGTTTEKYSEGIFASAVYSPDPESENGKWSQATPSLQLNMTISNPGAFGKLEQGKEYYLDFIPVEAAEPG